MIKTIPWDGKPVSKPGMYSGMSMEVYHSAQACDGWSISTTGLKKIFSESAADYWDTSPFNPERAEQDETAPLIFGRALHHLMLGEPNFQASYAEQPLTYEDEKTGEVKKWSNNSNPAKRWNAARAKEGRYVLDWEEVAAIRRIAHMLSTNPLVQAGILNGLVERSLFWKDEATGIWLKCRPDVVPTDSGDVADLKFVHSVDWDDLVKALYDFGYFQQGALVRAGLKAVLDIDMVSFLLFFVEKKRPNSPRPVIVKDIDLDFGAQANRAALDTLAKCIHSKEWPGPRSLTGATVEHIEMDVFKKNRLATKLSLMGYESPDFEGKR